VLRGEGVEKRYGELRALAGVSLDAERGRTTVLIGPSGCGKSTLLRCMIGVIRPDAGRVIFDGEVVGEGDLLSLRRRMGYVIQAGGLFPHLTAERNVGLVARWLGWSSERIGARIGALAELVRLPREMLGRFPAQLSGGQRQRVSLMRALMLDPAVLLMDEPLGALDPVIRSELQQDLRDIFRELHKTVVLVTHDMGEAAFFGDHIVLMSDGAIVQEGGIEELLRSPADPFVTRFINAQRSPLDEMGAAGG